MTTEHGLVDATIHITDGTTPAVLVDALEKRTLAIQRELQACRNLRALLAEMRLPRTLAGFRCPYLYVSEGYYKFDLTLEEGIRQEIAFGTIRKVIDALQAAGWTTQQDGIDLQPSSFGKTLNTTIAGERNNERLLFVFQGLPEGPHCRLVQETVEVPATTRIVMRVVCEDQEALPEATDASGAEG